MRKYIDFLEGTDGRALAGAFVRVLTYPAGTDATLFAEADGIVTLANPVRSDTTGEFSFYVADGHYTLEITGEGLSAQTITDISIFDEDNLVAAAAAASGAAGAAASAAGSATSAADSATTAAAAAALVATAGNSIIRATWTILSGIVGSAGQNALVLSSDTGTHTDPVVGGTVNNSGVFQYSTSPAGWQRIGDPESVLSQDGAASHYFVQISGAPVPLGGYIAEKFARTASTIRRFAYDVTAGPVTIEVRINGVIAHTGLDVSGRGEHDVTFTVPADATVDFYVTAGTPTYVWAMIDGARP